MTLRSAIEAAESNGRITFAFYLNGKTINLTVIGSEHTILKGELYNPDQTYAGYQERDYGASALYTRKNLTIDASSLSDGINWAGDDSSRARVLAVYGNLTLRKSENHLWFCKQCGDSGGGSALFSCAGRSRGGLGDCQA